MTSANQSLSILGDERGAARRPCGTGLRPPERSTRAESRDSGMVGEGR